MLHFGVPILWSRGVPDDYKSLYKEEVPPVKIDTAEELPDGPLVVLSSLNGKYIQGTEDLRSFVHPEKAI